MKRLNPLVVVAVLSGLAAATGAQAKPWDIEVGVKGSSAPPYEGSDVYRIGVSPIVNVRPADSPYRFTPPEDGATFALFVSEHFEFGPIVRFRSKRKNTGDLTGLDKIKWAAEPGAYLEIWPTKWLRIRSEARHGVGGHSGIVGEVGGDVVYMSPKWDFSVGPRVGWGDKEYLQTYFGVTPIEAIRSPKIAAAYAPGAGRRYLGAEVGTAYHFNDRFRVIGNVAYHRLESKAADSPIVAIAGSRNQWQASLGAAYTFTLFR